MQRTSTPPEDPLPEQKGPYSPPPGRPGARASSSPRFHVKRWLNVPRFPPFDRYGIPRGPIKVSRSFYKAKCQRVFDFTWPAVFWFLAKQFAGKSTGVEDVAMEYVDRGGTAIDIFSADDDEGAGWADSGYKVLFLCGNKVDLSFVKTSYDWMHVGDLKSSTPEEVIESIHKLEQYQVVVTVPGFFYNMNEMFRSLSYLLDLLKQRGRSRWSWPDHRRIFCLMVREAKVLLASRYYSGKISSRQDAEMDMIDLVDKAFHSGTALCLDSLRYMNITPEVRDITHFSFIKKLGRMKLPREFNFILRYVNPRFLRRMKRSQFVLYTDEDEVYYGTNDPVPWHVKRGEPVLERLGIKVTYKPENEKKKGGVTAPAPEAAEEEQSYVTPPPAGEDPDLSTDEVQTKKWKVSLAIHRRILSLIKVKGLSYKGAKEALEEGQDTDPPSSVKLSVATLHKEVHSHDEGLCLCPEDEPGRGEGGEDD